MNETLRVANIISGVFRRTTTDVNIKEYPGTSCSGNFYTSFGGGPRLCPGYELARVEISVFLQHLVTQFSWVPAEEDKLVFFPTTRTQKRYPINLRRRC
ncbi:hypothetical protein GQ457_05G032040 [Hibiscus cannabinus]